MEENQPQGQDANTSLTLDNTARSYLIETAKWAKFLAIVGFVFIAFMVIAAFTLGGMVSEMYELAEVPGLQYLGGTFVTIIYLAMALLYFFPTLYLYRFAIRTKAALLTASPDGLRGGFENLKSTFKYMGVLMIIMLGFYALMLVFGVMAAVIGGGLTGGEGFAT